MTQKMHVSAIIIARNEESRIANCIKSLAWADECLVIDNDSRDQTAEIARKHGAQVIEEKSKNFSQIRNAGANKARGVWLLYVDADEIVTQPLRDEIIRVVESGGVENAFYIPRQNYYLGVQWPAMDGMVRLMRKSAFVTWSGVLHEHAEIKGDIGVLKNYFVHHTHRTLSEMVTKTNEWSVSEATLRYANGHPHISWWRLLRVMMTGFFNSYISQGGWRVGLVGWIESIYQGFSMFITYAKLWEMQRKQSTT